MIRRPNRTGSPMLFVARRSEPSRDGQSSWLRVFVLGALAGAAGLGCDVFRSGANPEVPLWVHRPSWSMNVVYKRPVVAPARAEGEPYQRGQPAIDPKRRRVFVGSSDYGLYALRADDGSVIWRFETLSFVQGVPLYEPGENVVYFGSNDGALYKVDADSGRLVWRFATNAEVAARPVLKDNVLYAVNANDTVIALDPRNGKLIWSQHRTPALGMEVAGYSGPLVWRGKVYVGFSDGTVMAFDARTGDERWPAVDLAAEAEQTLGDVPTYFDVDTTPVADVLEVGPVVYVGSYAGGVFALDAETGTQVWANPAVAGVSELTLWTQPARPAPDGIGPDEPARKLLIASTGTTGLWALDPESGREVWRRELPQGGVSAPVPIAGALMVSTTQLGVFLLSPLDGRLIDGLHTGDGSSMTPIAHGLRAFIVTNGGHFLSIHVTPPSTRPTSG
jgi:outer membrane protein assembly factor BamB